MALFKKKEFPIFEKPTLHLNFLMENQQRHSVQLIIIIVIWKKVLFVVSFLFLGVCKDKLESRVGHQW